MSNYNTILIHYYSSPMGDLLLGSFNQQLCLCDWVERSNRQTVDKRIQHFFKAKYVEADCPVIKETISQLEQYFAGQRKTFSIPLLFAGTEFQQRVWQALLNIPFGTVVTYGEQAEKLGDAKAVRAVASANGANAISIIVPCHRIIARDGKLTGYAGGLPAKQQLLQLEQPNQPLQPQQSCLAL